MPKLLPETVALRTLRGEQVPARCRITREQAIDLLKRTTGQDFGEDADKWAASLRARSGHRKGQGMDEDRNGVFIALLPGGEVKVELDDGLQIIAIVPAVVRRKLFILKPGMRLRVRHRAAGCSQVIGPA